MNIVYLGYNSFRKFKRGVENVILFQSKSFHFDKVYYLHWGNENKLYRYNNIICISIKKNIFLILTLNILLRKIRKIKRTIVHSHNPLMSFFYYNKSELLTVHDGLYYQNKANNKSKLLCFIFKLIEKRVYNKTITIHFISNYTKSKSLYTSGDYRIIYNTTNLENIKQVEDNYLQKDKYFTILIIRSIERRSNLDLIINLASKLNNQKYKIIIAGKGPLLNHYKNIIINNKLKNIEMLGYVSDFELVNLYKKTDIVCMPAIDSEGFGLPIIEAYLFNKPVIASNVCAIPEIIFSKHFLFENNIDSLVNVIYSLDSIGKIDFKNYYDIKFSNIIIMPQYFQLYSSLIAR